MQKLKAFFIIAAISVCAACQPSQRIIEDGKRNATPTPTATETTAESSVRDDFEERLKSVERGNFSFVYSFRRKDGEVFSGEDKKILKQNSPADTNQWVLSSDGKAIIAGSNYLFTTENLKELKKHFEVADHSAIINRQENTNANQEK